MSRIVLVDAQAWAEGTKLTIDQFDPALLSQVEAQVLTTLDNSIDVSTWVDSTTTPDIVRSIIAMMYVSWLYDRTYSEDQDAGNDYAIMLRAQAQGLIAGINDSSVVIPGFPTENVGGPLFYPTDTSSALLPTTLNPELGPASFQMGRQF